MIHEASIEKQEAYIKTIKQVYPALDIRSARLHTGEGQFNDVLFVNEELIFRFPRYQASVIGFLQEIEILKSLQGRLPLPIPNPVYVNSESKAAGEVFMGYRRIPGKPLFKEVLDRITEEFVLVSFAKQLADFLRELHHISPAALGMDLSPRDQRAETQAFFTDIKEGLFPLMRPEARASVSHHFEGYFDNASLHKYEPALIHGDFGGSNILHDGDRITGVIDFGFAGLGDPATDIAAISTFGNSFFARIWNFYPLTESVLERARFYRGTFALNEALHGLRNNDKEAFDRGMEQYL